MKPIVKKGCNIRSTVSSGKNSGTYIRGRQQIKM